MQLLEAATISLINTVIILVLHFVVARHRKNVTIHGPFIYKLNESGALKEISSESVSIKDMKALQEKILNQVTLRGPRLFKKTEVLSFALIIFVAQLIILMQI